MGFPYFQKYSEMLSQDLTANPDDNKNVLDLTPQEANDIFEQTGCRKLEDYIIELGENSDEFQKVIVEFIGESQRTNNILTILREMWIECNVLRQTAVYLRQSFTDSVSRAVLTNARDKNSKLARSILCMSLREVKGIKKGTNNYVISLEKIVYMFVEKQAYKFQNIMDGIDKIDKELAKGFGKDEVKVK